MVNSKLLLLFSLTLVLLSLPLASAEWFDDGNTFKWERTLTIASTSAEDVIRVDVNTVTFPSGFGNIFDSTTNDGNTFAFLDPSTKVRIPHEKLYFNEDINLGFDLNVGSSNTSILMRYGDDTNTTNNAIPWEVYTVFSNFDGDDLNRYANWTPLDGSWSVVNEKLQWDSGANRDVIYTDIGSSVDYSGGFLLEASHDGRCEECGLGINTDTDPAGGTADGYDYFAEIALEVLRLQERDNGVNTLFGTSNTTPWDGNNVITMNRDSTGNFTIRTNFSPQNLNFGSDTTTTAGQFIVFIHGNTATNDALDFVRFTEHFNIDSTFVSGAEVDSDVNGLTITVRDEITQTAIVGATIDFNAGTYVTDGSGQIIIPLTGVPADANTQLTVNVDVNSDYTSRDFIFDFNITSDITFTALMLETDQGSARAFQIFQPDETTVIANSIIEFRRNLDSFQGLSSRIKTDGSGNVTFFGQQDANYVMRTFDESTTPFTQRDYNGTLLTVKIPLDATATATEITPFIINVGGLASQALTNLTADEPVQIYSDTVEFYTITVDDNASDVYFPTSVLIQSKGGEATQEFQPYLVPDDATNLEATIFTINNPEGRKTLTGIRIDSITDINGTATLVEQKFSDGTGQGVFHFVKGQTYLLRFFEPDGTPIFNATIEANDTQFFAFIDLLLLQTVPSPQGTIAVNWFPTLGNVLPVDNNINVFQILRPTNFTIGDVNVFATYLDDSNVFFNRVFTVNSSNDFNLSYGIPVDGLDSNFSIKVFVQVFDSNSIQIGQTFSNTYTFSDAFNVGIFDDAREILGIFLVTLLSIGIVVLMIGEISVRTVGENKNGIGILAIVLTGVFVLVGWVAFADWIAAAFLGLGAYMFGVTR